jgi:AcrR family transcriptional regulator
MKAEGQPRQATAQRIIEATRDLMIEQGLLEISLAEISQRAGTNVALVSYYFGNREGLMVALAESDSQGAMTGLERLLAADLTPTAKIERHIRGMIGAYFERPYLHRLLQKLIREGSPEAKDKIGQYFQGPVARARRTIIEEGIRLGEFQDIDIDLANFALDGACAHIFSSVEARRVVLGDGGLDRALIDRYIQTVTRLIIGGLAAPPISTE